MSDSTPSDRTMQAMLTIADTVETAGDWHIAAVQIRAFVEDYRRVVAERDVLAAELKLSKEKIDDYDELNTDYRELQADLAEKQGDAAHAACVEYDKRVRELGSQLAVVHEANQHHCGLLSEQGVRLRVMEKAFQAYFDFHDQYEIREGHRKKCGRWNGLACSCGGEEVDTAAREVLPAPPSSGSQDAAAGGDER